jgi:hypothetical protein
MMHLEIANKSQSGLASTTYWLTDWLTDRQS